MNSMHPVVVLGSYRWDEELLPVDEFGERLKVLRALMRERGWQGVVAHGDAPDSAFVTWLTHFFPRMRWALALVGLQGEPELLFAAPAIVAMFLAELGLALVSRFTPQLQVFFLAMPIKSALALLVLVLYMSTLFEYAGDTVRGIPGILPFLDEQWRLP